MAAENIKPGYTYKSGTATASYTDNRIEPRGNIGTMKICNDGAGVISFVLNSGEDSIEVDGEIPAGKELELSDINFGISSIALKGSGAYRLWAYA